MNREHVVPSLVSLVICCFLALQSGIANGAACPPAAPVCPPGTTFNAAVDQCQADFSPCLPGYLYSTSSNKCEVSAPAATSSASCPVGSSFNPVFGKCETANLSPCPSGYTYNASSNKCEIPATFTAAAGCPTGYTFDSAGNKCIGAPNSACSQGGFWGYYEQACCSGSQLPGFSWDDETGQYVGPWVCPPGYSNSNGACSGPMATASCPAGSTINSYTSKCETVAGPVCAAGQTYNTYNTKCDFAPLVSAAPSTCPPGYILNVATNVCAGATSSACPFGGSWGYYEQACTSNEPHPGYSWDDETGQYCGPASCPTGFGLITSSSSCSGTACQNGLVYNPATSACEAPAPVTASTLNCPANSSFNPVFGKCETANLSPCPSGYTYNASTNRCEIPATFTPAAGCPDGYTFDSASNKCIGAPNSACSQGGFWGYYEQACCSGSQLPGFSWDDETGQYVGPWVCPPGYSNGNGTCSGPMATASCPAGTTINSYTSKCETAAGPVCAAGQTYNTYNTKCDFAPLVSADAPTCPPGYILNVNTNVCAGVISSACPFGGSWGNYEQACTSNEPLPGYSWDDETGQYCGPASCPTGFGLITSSSSCSGTACQTGHAFNAATSSCQPSGCPAGTVKSNDLCIAAAVCLP